MFPAIKLEMVHMQITRRCNLHCWFCGQWGEKGSFSSSEGRNMTYSDWDNIIHQLDNYTKISGKKPCIMIWGGEPLLSPDFDALVNRLNYLEYELGMVTNGTLIDKHIKICKQAIQKIYISVDGPEEIHDSIRGKGVFQKVKENISLLKGGNAKIVLMAVLTEKVRNRIDWLLDSLAVLEPDEVILQEFIGLSKTEVAHYKQWMLEQFQVDATNIESWESEQSYEPISLVKYAEYPFPVSYLPHGKRVLNEYCLSPFRHLHITWNGNVTFCTDFYDFSAGNVKTQSLQDIFYGIKANDFRREIMLGNCVTCNHCSWKNSIEFKV